MGPEKAPEQAFAPACWRICLALFLVVFSANPSFSGAPGEARLNDSDRTLVDIQISGKVTDVNGVSLPGVNILYKNSTIGTVTDLDGNYSITVPEGSGTLVFSFIGYVTQEIPIDSRTVINATMEESATALNEVIVTALGIEQRKEEITYSTQTVNTEQLTEARELNIMNSLKGKVAGLSITTSGSGLGAPARVVLRGNRSITGDSQPLYVVDGVPISGNPTELNSDNIASINVLKGPNAAALYGSAAQNGAIIITTLTGKAGVTNVSLNTSFMLREPQILTKFQNVYGQGQSGVYDKGSEFSWGPKMEGQMVEHWSPDPALAGTTYPFTPQPDNNLDVYQTGYNLATNLLATIGGEKTQAVVSYTFTDAKGTLPGNELNRNNLSIRVLNQLSDRITLDAKMDYMNQTINNGYFGGRYNPTRMIYRLPRNIHTEHIADFEYTDAEGLNRQNYFNPGSAIGGNPYWILHRTLNEVTRQRIISMASLTYDFTDELSLMLRGAYDGSNGGNEDRLYNDNYADAPYGMFEVGKSEGMEFNADFLLTYNKILTQNLDVQANLGGNTRIQRNSSVVSSTGDAMIVPNFFALSNTNFPETTHNPGSSQNIQSLYAFTKFSWQNAVFLDLTGRNDWSSTLPADNRSYFYPSVGLSAVMSELIPNFSETISFARIRASWAQVGNSASPYMLRRTASFSAGGTNGFIQLSSTLPNPDLRPEMTESFEVGLDFRFLQNRMGLDITAYKTNTKDQLFTVALPVGSGASQFYTNGGDVENKGIEVLLSASPVQTTDFNWDINLNYALNRNMVNRISDERPRLNLTPSGFFSNFIIEEGQPFGNIYSRGWLRDDQGRVLIGANGMPRVTSGITELVANFSPDWTGSFLSSFDYKGLTASFLIEHRQGGTVASETNAILYADGVTEQTLLGREGGLIFGQNIFPGETAILEDGTPNNIPIDAELFWRGIGGRNTPVGEAFVDDATNTRLRELTLGYTFDQTLFGGLPVSNVKLSLVGRNLFFIYRASENLDPDFMGGTSPTSEGTQAFTPATTRSYGVNLKINF